MRELPSWHVVDEPTCGQEGGPGPADTRPVNVTDMDYDATLEGERAEGEGT
jgi:hypothetical protein